MSSTVLSAPLPATDARAINAVLDHLTLAWNRHDIDAFVAEMTPDVDWINVVGMHWRGRDAVRGAHVALHRGMFANSTMLPHDTIETRQLSPDVVMVVYNSSIEGVGATPGGMPYPADGAIMTVILVRTGDGWRIAHAHNTFINTVAVAHDPGRAPG